MKIQLAAKFQKKLMDSYHTLVRTHARTDATENNGPSPINRGTKMIFSAKNFFQKNPTFASPTWFNPKNSPGVLRSEILKGNGY